MQKIKLDSGEVKEVPNNEAHGLIESGKAKIFKAREAVKKRYKKYRDKMVKKYFNKEL